MGCSSSKNNSTHVHTIEQEEVWEISEQQYALDTNGVSSRKFGSRDMCVFETQRRTRNKVSTWRDNLLPVVESEILEIILDFAIKSTKIHSLIRLKDDLRSLSTISDTLCFCFVVDSTEPKKSIFQEFTSGFKDIIVHKHEHYEHDFKPSMTIFINTHAGVPWGQQILQISIMVVDNVPQIYDELVCSGAANLILEGKLSTVLVLDKHNLTGKELEEIVKQSCDSECKSSGVKSAIESNAWSFVEQFEKASLEHSRGDRFRFWFHMCQCYQYLCMLFHIETNINDCFHKEAPIQLFQRLQKSTHRELLNLEPKSTLQVPFSTTLKKEYVVHFCSILKKLEEKLEDDLLADKYQQILESVMARDLYPNFRDAATGTKSFRPGILYRSATLNNHSDEELRTLFKNTGVRTVLDIRSPDDIVNKGYSASLFVSCEIKYMTIPIKPWTAKKVPAEMGAIKFTYVKECTEDNGWGFYEIFPKYFAKEIGGILHALLKERKPLLIHCTLGKDRTGCVVALLQALIGCSMDEVISDYLNSHRNALASNIETFFQVLEEFGGVQAYVIKLGFSMEDIQMLRDIFRPAEE